MILDLIYIKYKRIMGETRIEKYKEYRSSITTSGAPSFETPKMNKASSVRKEDNIASTSTLPMDQVIQGLQAEYDEEALFIKKQKRRKIILYSLAGIFAIGLIAAIVVVGVILFA